MKRKLLALLIMCMVIVCMVGCLNTSKQTAETSPFTANIDKYWKENNIDAVMKQLNIFEDELADMKTTLLETYGENKEITGEFDENLAAKTVNGTYVGKVISDKVVSWKGIPYAKQPIGDLRWRAPEKPEKSDKVYEAYYFGKSAVQVETKDEPSGLYPQGEDCLNINIWSNKANEASNKPIMVWIHGGAYIQGGANTEEYDGTNFVINNPDVIYASIDYRVDFLGFVNLSNVPGAEDYNDSANLGLLDEIQALSWLKENAKAFGGDPERITIFGESAGGGSASSLTLAPQAKNLFKRAIMQSGVSSGFLRTQEKSIKRTEKIMEISGAKNIDDLKSLTTSDIRKIASIIGAEDPLDYTYPQCDGIVVPFDIKEVLESNQRNGIDIMIGTTKDEYNYWTMLLGKENNLKSMKASRDRIYGKMNDAQKERFEKFMSMQDGDEYNKLMQYINYIGFHSPSRFEARTHANNGQNAYLYYFTEESTDFLSCHGYDLGFVLGNVETERVKDIDSANRLSRIMQQMWVNFALTGDPSLKDGDIDGVSAIKWDKYKADDYKLMIFNAEEIKQEKDPLNYQNNLVEDLFWLKIQN